MNKLFRIIIKNKNNVSLNADVQFWYNSVRNPDSSTLSHGITQTIVRTKYKIIASFWQKCKVGSLCTNYCTSARKL